MSDILRSLILGIVQGLTEFLPVSSSGHLEIMNQLLGSNSSIDSDLTMVVLVHLGTAFSILYVFRADILALLQDTLSFKKTENSATAMKILLSMIPAGILGVLFEEKLEALFSGTILWVGLSLIFTAVVLYFTPNRQNEKGTDVSYTNAAGIGIAQAVAMLPGVSRSGMTIATALFMGINKEEAARFSFLMVLPVIFGKVLLDGISGDLAISQSNIASVSVALISSFLVGVWACNWMMSIVKKSKLQYFAYYCFVVGLLTIGLHFYG